MRKNQTTINKTIAQNYFFFIYLVNIHHLIYVLFNILNDCKLDIISFSRDFEDHEWHMHDKKYGILCKAL